MPTKKGQQNAIPLAVPELGKDSTERKRVLNVLAQRRYRQKRKEHIRKLEAQAVVAEPVQDEYLPQTSPSSNGVSHGNTSQGSEEDPAAIDGQQLQCPFAAAHLYRFEDDPLMPIDSDLDTTVPPTDPFADIFPGNQELWDTSILIPSLPSTPVSTSKHSSSSDSETWSGALLSTARHSPKQWPVRLQPPRLPVQNTMYSFSDDAYLQMSELTLMNGCMAIARRLNMQQIIWSIEATSPFADPAMSMADFNHLPANLQPTLRQMTMPHHPVIDLLPWPAVRDRMIMVLSQPPENRPPGAASPMALVEFVYDIEDSTEGVRISGGDPLLEQNWELGEKVFKSWWWMFDRDIVRRSNELRTMRGAPLLGGSILGEVA